MKASLTPMQMKVYRYIVDYHAEHGTVPSNAEIGAAVKTPRSNAYRLLQGLIARGYINPGPPRTVRSYSIVDDAGGASPSSKVHVAASDFVQKHRAFMNAVERGQDTEAMGHDVQQALQKLNVEVGGNV